MVWTNLRAFLLGSAASVLAGGMAVAQSSLVPATPLDAVTSSATRTERVAGDAASSVSVVTREEIEQRMPSSMDDLVKDLPGVEVNGVPRNSARQISIRGLGDERVVLRIDGVRNNFSAGHRGRMFLDTDVLKQIDVVRGPGSVLFGSGAMGGAVNLRTIDAEDVLKPGATLGGRARVGYQTNNSARTTSLTGAARADDVQLLANVGTRSNGSYHDGKGKDIPWSGDEILSGLVKARIDRMGHQVGVAFSHFRNDHTIPTSANSGAETGLVIADRDTLQRAYSVNWAFASPSSPLFDARVSVYRNEIDIVEKRVPGAAARLDETGLATLGFDAQNTARFSFGAADAQTLTFGIDGYRDTQRSARNGAPRTEFPGATQSIVGGFVQNEMQFYRLVTFTPGLRFDSFRQQADNNATQRSENRVSPKASLAVQATPWMAPYVSYAEAFRVPSLTERFVSGTHFPGNTFVANPNLKPETAANKEGGVNLNFGGVRVPNDRLRGRVAYFVNDIEDFIEQTVNATTTTTANVPKARIQGAEAELRYDSAAIFGSLGAASLRGDNRRTSQPLAGIPADRVNASLGYRFADQGVALGTRVVYSTRQSRVATGTPATGGYAVYDLFATWVPEEGGLRNLRVDFGIDNVFDKAYRRSNWQANPAPLFYEVGRNVKLAVGYTF